MLMDIRGFVTPDTMHLRTDHRNREGSEIGGSNHDRRPVVDRPAGVHRIWRQQDPRGPEAERPFVRQQNRDLPRVHFRPKFEGGYRISGEPAAGRPSGRTMYMLAKFKGGSNPSGSRPRGDIAARANQVYQPRTEPPCPYAHCEAKCTRWVVCGT